MSEDRPVGTAQRWAHLRFAVVGPLLASPPARGELAAALERLAATSWQHPVTGDPVHFAASTLERWYYAARAQRDPVGALRRKVCRDRGRQWAVSRALGEALRAQHAAHSSWSYQLHLDNLRARVADAPELGPLPSYASLRRYMVAHRLRRQRRRCDRELSAGQQRAEVRRETREMRRYETPYVQGLWHLDFHHGSLKILTPKGEWVRPRLLAILDDRSRLACHVQWYLEESAESLVHGLSQALIKRGLPRSLMTDNGGAMLAAETREGLAQLSILHQTTQPYTPEQNGKQEVFWAQVEGRLLAMLEGQAELSLGLLNQATQAWVEMEYQRRVHRETRQAPLDRWLEGPYVGRPCPEPETLHLAFTARQVRTQRASDGTISLEGTRFEIPTRFRHLRRATVRYASWNLGRVWLTDEDTGVVLDRLYPVDLAKNAESVRRALGPLAPASEPGTEPGIAPLLRRLIEEYAATGLPPAYLPKETRS